MQIEEGRKFIGRFKSGSGLLESLSKLSEEENIRLGTFNVIGVVTSAKMGYYKQDKQEYAECVSLNGKFEIVSCVGNISLKDGKIFVHAHIMLADHDGKCCGGHLMPGTNIFAAEYFIQELVGGKLERKHDPETGLSLWG